MTQTIEELDAELEQMLTQLVEAEELLAGDPDDEEVKMLIKEVEDAVAALESKLEEKKAGKNSVPSTIATSPVPPQPPFPQNVAVMTAPSGPPLPPGMTGAPPSSVGAAPPLPPQPENPVGGTAPFVTGPLGTVGSLCMAEFDGRSWLRAVVKAQEGHLVRVEFLGYGGGGAAATAVATERLSLAKLKPWQPDIPIAGSKVQAYSASKGEWTDATVERVSPLGVVTVRFGKMGSFGHTNVEIAECHMAQVNIHCNQPVPLRRRQILTAAEIAAKTQLKREKQKEKKQAKNAAVRAMIEANTKDWAAERDGGSDSDSSDDAPVKKKQRIF